MSRAAAAARRALPSPRRRLSRGRLPSPQINADVQPTYVRVEAKKNTLQLLLPCEVLTDSSVKDRHLQRVQANSLAVCLPSASVLVHLL